MRVLGIIPARSGSKRVPDKNIRMLNGKPLIAYTIQAAKDSKLLNEFVVSTDSEKYKTIAEDFGASTILRPESLAQDTTPDKPVIIHLLQHLKEQENKTFDAVVLLRPTAPFRTGTLIDSIIEKASSENISSIRTVTQATGVHHPYWMYTEENNRATSLIEGKSAKEYYQSQMLPEVFRLNGVVDLIMVNTLYNEENLYGENMSLYKIPEEQSFDIDTETDFKICEALMCN